MIEEKNSGFMSAPLTEGTKLAAQQAMHSQYVLQLLQLQRRAGFLCDITINIEEKSFKAHKPLLAACSLYFRALFAECGDVKPSTLNLQLSANGFEVLLDYIYSGSLAITSENSDQVLHAANCLQMTNVVETCLNFVRSSFKATSGESLKPGRPDAFELPIALHGSEATKIALNQAQVQGNPLHLAVGSDKVPNQSLPLQAVPIQSDKSNANNTLDGINSTANDSHPDTIVDSTSIISPTSEALTMIMPYLVAKNARRPTLSEVRQLLSAQNSISSEHMDSITIGSVKSLPPRLIPAHPERSQEADDKKQQSRNPTEANLDESHQIKFGVTGVQQNLSGESNIASLATVNAGHNAHQKRINTVSKNIQPFVMVSTQNNDLFTTKPDDISKSSAWSDDRSVKNDHIRDQLQTHLSSTPCPANLTVNTSCINTAVSQQRPYPAASPESFGSTPSIEISPISDISDSPTGEVTLPLKLRWARTQSLDCAKGTAVRASENSPTKSAEEIRSSSLSPRFFRNDSPKSDGQPSLISAEEAASAAGALLIKGPFKKRRLSNSIENDTTQAKEGDEIDNKVDKQERECNGPEVKKFNASLENCHDENHNAMSPTHQGLLIKQELVYTPSTSPPTEESYPIMDQEDALSRSTTPSVATTASHEGVVDENGVLDLSVQKTSNNATSSVTSLSIPVVGNDAESVPKDPKAKEALDALVMMQTSSAASAYEAQNFASPSPEEGSLNSVFSRKPRRSSGGQTCHWPGCGRLFRHRNIFEEHLKLHEIGVPVTKLRRCYMGARVKKTARERLDEMRSVEGATNVQHSVSDGNEINTPAYQRASHKRKRASSSQTKEGADRKRVTAKDRKDHLARNNSWQQQTQASIQHTPLYSRPPAVPLSVLHTVASEAHHQHSSWPLRVQAPTLVNGAAHLNLLSYRNALPTVLTKGGNGVAVTNSDSDHSTTVVQALTALGIPIPSTNRDGSLMESPQRTCIPGAVLTSPNSGVVLDQLRRSIAFRETPDAAVALTGDSRIGNVSRSKFSPNGKAVVTSNSAISSHSTRPSPNSYHSSSVVQRVAKI